MRAGTRITSIVLLVLGMGVALFLHDHNQYDTTPAVHIYESFDNTYLAGYELQALINSAKLTNDQIYFQPTNTLVTQDIIDKIADRSVYLCTYDTDNQCLNCTCIVDAKIAQTRYAMFSGTLGELRIPRDTVETFNLLEYSIQHDLIKSYQYDQDTGILTIMYNDGTSYSQSI
ncbi:hypothetical protein [Butyrivibrio sp.]|uniref:hypothetical protein n=1 Tax=Butyrivibrio sp. TaxID=28121 RepID=UPI0025B893E9|nr:hypothetical protein [Butyrivibrio sp.]MBQ9303161.1 hypothetical protein [Butyrivibrio sp.]